MSQIPDLGANVVSRMIELLVNRVRAATVDQLAHRFGRRPAVSRTLTWLKRRGLIVSQTLMMEPILALDAPVIAWSPGDDVPNFGQVSWRLRTRWRAVPKQTVVSCATAKARRLFGGVIGGRPLRACEVRHDCHVAEVYFQLERKRPELAKLWVPEDALIKQQHEVTRERIPDAIIATSPPMAIDFGGSYRTPKLLSFHRAMAAQSIPYEIW